MCRVASLSMTADCVFCRIPAREDAGHSRKADVVFRSPETTVFVSTGRWTDKYSNVLVIQKDHYESLFDLPDELASLLHHTGRIVADGLVDVFECDSISVRQDNRPAGGQEVLHWHIHLTPRYPNDVGAPKSADKEFTDDNARAECARQLRSHLEHDSHT